ncbi:hypothetical protein BDF19DRAFT_451717 [Syncephalis fuscata]|nr:hypothetical protein BDF19DRAFT_451717 [Syncephalis fuscata]
MASVAAENSALESKRVCCESCRTEAPDTIDPDLQFRIIGSTVLCPGCEPLFATGLRGKRRVLLPPWALNQASFDKLDLDNLGKKTRMDMINYDHTNTRSPRSTKSIKISRKKHHHHGLPVKQENTEEPTEIEYFREDMANEEGESWLLYCDQCRMVIRQFRYYCTYCEIPSQDKTYSSFELCINCFTNFFPWHHQHPRSSFAEQCVLDESSITSVKTTRELAVRYELDLFDYTFNPKTDLLDATKTLEEFSAACGRDGISTTTATTASAITAVEPINVTVKASLAEADTGYAFLERWSKRRRCALCNDDETGGELGDFIGPCRITIMKGD